MIPILAAIITVAAANATAAPRQAATLYDMRPADTRETASKVTAITRNGMLVLLTDGGTVQVAVGGTRHGLGRCAAGIGHASAGGRPMEKQADIEGGIRFLTETGMASLPDTGGVVGVWTYDTGDGTKGVAFIPRPKVTITPVETAGTGTTEADEPASSGRNRTEDGTVTLGDGLQYRITRKGDGRVPDASSDVSMRYRLKDTDGNILQDGWQRPTTFPVADLIEGMREALVRIPEGSEAEIRIPSSLAYGDEGNAIVRPGQTIVLDIALEKTR